MEGISIQLQIIAGIAVVGALVETFFPGLISEKLKDDLSVLTIAIIGILLSFLLLMLLLKARIREGFEESELPSKFQSLLTSNQAKEVCALYTEMYDKMVTTEKGAPPEEQKTDAQAREVVDKQFTDQMSVSPVSCSLVDKLEEAKTIDTLYEILPTLPDNLLVQIYETGTACRSLLIANYLRIQDAENKRKEGFEDIAVCGDEAAKERKAFLERKPLSQEAQQCMLVEEIPAEKKRQVLEDKLNKLTTTFVLYKQTKKIQDSISKVLEDCNYYKQKLDEKKQEAEATSNRYNW
jgi:hypothetical protein